MNVLIVDDEPEILKKVSLLVEENGFTVKTLSSFEGLDSFLKTKSFYPKVIVLDRILGGRDSIDLIQKIKATFDGVRILVVSAVDTALEKAKALNCGADDYLAKPFSAVELVARLNVLMRRDQVYIPSDVLKAGNLTLQMIDRTVLVEDKESLLLSHKEFQLLFLFASNPGKIFPKDSLMREVWKSSAEVESKVVEATMNNLRRKLEASGASIKIKNIRNVGYWFEV